MGGVCACVFVSVCVCMWVSEQSWGQILGIVCSNFPFLGQQQKSRQASTSIFSFSHTLSFSFTICLFISAQDLWRWADLNPKFPALTHTLAQVWPRVFFLLFVDISDSWSLAVCEQGRVRMRTACESTHRTALIARCGQRNIVKLMLNSSQVSTQCTNA